MRTCSGHRRIVRSESVLSFVTWSRMPRLVKEGDNVLQEVSTTYRKIGTTDK